MKDDEIITCPLCQKPVHLANDPKGTRTAVFISQPDDFYCTTYVNVTAARSWCHYSRRTRQGWYTEYEAIIPPFQVWWTTNGELRVARLITEPHRTLFEDIYHVDKADFEEFIRICNRFKNLKVFS